MRCLSAAAGCLTGLFALGLVTPSSAGEPGCDKPDQAIRVVFSKDDYPHIIRHIKESWDLGYPKVLKINRDGADRRRDKLLARRDTDGDLLYPTREGFDRDEAPAAVLRKKVDAD